MGRYGATHTVDFGKIAITNGRKRGGTVLGIPWVLAKRDYQRYEVG